MRWVEIEVSAGDLTACRVGNRGPGRPARGLALAWCRLNRTISLQSRTMPIVDLFSKLLGGEGKPPLVIAHGLLGSSRNWQTCGKRFSEHFEVHALDLRNHGESPHDDEMSFQVMGDDIGAWLESRRISEPVLLGHSMGGKSMANLATRRPELLRALIVEDIAPKPYPPRWEREFAAMKALPVGVLKSRTEAEKLLEEEVKDWAFRKFLVTNLERDTDGGGLRWTVNLDLLHRALPRLFERGIEEGARFEKPVLFVRGERSKFVDPKADEDLIGQFFPQAELVTIPGAGHNVHFDAPEAFVEAVVEWVTRVVDGSR